MVHTVLLLSMVHVLTRSTAKDLRGAVWRAESQGSQLCMQLPDGSQASHTLTGAQLPPKLLAPCSTPRAQQPTGLQVWSSLSCAAVLPVGSQELMGGSRAPGRENCGRSPSAAMILQGKEEPRTQGNNQGPSREIHAWCLVFCPVPVEEPRCQVRLPRSWWGVGI